MTEPQLIPINAKFGDDFVMQLVFVTTADTMAEVAQKVAHHVVRKRITPQDRVMVVYCDGRPVAEDATVAQVGIGPGQHVLVDYAR